MLRFVQIIGSIMVAIPGRYILLKIKWRNEMKIVETDNLDGDYPNETFLKLPSMTEEYAQKIVDAINEDVNNRYNPYPRYWKIVPDDYKLQPGFTP
jgi:hypothetical protein